MNRVEAPPFLQPSQIGNNYDSVTSIQNQEPHASHSTCKNCHKSFQRLSYYFEHVRKKKCNTQGFFCRYCPHKFSTNTLKNKHELQHKLSLADQQVGYGLQHIGQAHSCSVYEEIFEPGQILTVEGVFSLRNSEIVQIIKQNLHEKKIIKFGTVVTGRFEIPGDDSQNINPVAQRMEMPMRSEYNMVLLGSSKKIPNLIQKCKRETLSRMEDLELMGSGWSLTDIKSIRLEVGRCSLLGGCSSFEQNDYVGREHIIDVPISDEKCFLSAVAQHFLHGSHTGAALENWINENLNVKSLSFPLEVSKIAKFEKQNTQLGIRINCFLKEGNQCYPIYRSDEMGGSTISLVLIAYTCKGSPRPYYHYVYSKDIDGFLNMHLSHTNARRKQTTVHCDNCLTSFNCAESLETHRSLCLKNETQLIKIVNSGYKEFDGHLKKYGHPYIGVVDFESALVPTERMKHPTCKNCQSNGPKDLCRHSTFEQNEQVPVCYSLIFIDRNRNIVFSRCETGPNIMPLFFKALEDARDYLMPKLQAHKENTFWTQQEENKFHEAKECHVCHKPFSNDPQDCGKYKKVRDHDHDTGKPVGACHWICNNRRRVKRKLIVYAHNLQGYDSHFLFRYYSNDYVTSTTNMFAIPTNTEKFKAFEMCGVQFIDSLAFLEASLSEMVEDLKAEDCKFDIIRKSGLCENSEQLDWLLRSKGIYPYEYITGYEVLKEKALPPKEKFYSTLSNANVSDEEYNQAVSTYKIFQCQSIEDYTKLYCITDTMQLAEAILSFVEEVQKDFGLDVTNYVSLPSVSFDAMLKMTGAKLDFLPDSDMVNLFESSIRGGVSFVNKRYSNVEEEGGEILYLDFTNLYGFSQCQKLPTSEYTWLNEEEISNMDLSLIDEDGSFGYGLEVDLEYPIELHKAHNDLPLAPENINIFYDDLSPYSKECLKMTCQTNPLRYKSQKLCGTFKTKEKYFTHIKNLKYYLKLGLKLKKIHRVIKFRQDAFVKPYIEYAAKKRAQSKSPFKNRNRKKMTNANYGRFIMNVRKHIEVKLVSKQSAIEKHMSSPRLKSFRILNSDLTAFFMKKKKITLDKQWSVGWAILELSKLALFQLYYDILVPRFGLENIEVIMSDTDSLILHIKNYKDSEITDRLHDVLDFSNYPSEHPRFSKVRSKIPGFIKNEYPSSQITECVALKAKSYAFQMRDKKSGKIGIEKKCKGVTKARTRTLKFASYKKCLSNFATIKATVARISVKNHRITSILQQRVCLSSFDDKRYLLECGVHSTPYKDEGIPQNSKCPQCNMTQI